MSSFISLLKDALRIRDWKRKGSSFVKTFSLVQHEVFAYKSRYSESYGVNLRINVKTQSGATLTVIELSTKELHPSPREWAQIVDDAELLCEEERIALINEMIEKYWTPWLEQFTDEDALRSFLLNLSPGVGPRLLVDPKVWDHFGLPFWNGRSQIRPC